MELTATEQTRLLRLARETLNAFLTDSKIPEWQHDEILSALNTVKTGAFVTLTHGEQLRGCIGFTESDDPLPAVIQEAAIAAATRDPRFPSVRATELSALTIEISVLTLPEPVPDISLIGVGRHGLIVEREWSRGLLLPQVPVEWGWDREEFLAHACEKAGLPITAWQDPDTKIYWFEAIVFHEDNR
ncbi:MAG: AmmeMemoRadiSam system protein A [Candidatus Marinimicrobia bacterium]|nr:AmmeMemoRadiSam system protein A [Candidatus Neomarinimicrobiota bacterium]MCF7839571.1 AmmeMemoRadiSam system protein A [Candidatus Neomarinimicrobiota bacterium]MCF7903157.1 AmmeMemoRadiSam system protein A [Candidatus Neomarinimicrobiota bacterium]